MQRLICFLAAGLLVTAAHAQRPSAIKVEIDYMADNTHSHRPSRDEIDAVVQMFACQGIDLTVIIDDELQHADVLLRDPDDESNFFEYEYERHPYMSFLGIKNEHFDRDDGGWHYAVFGHQYQNSDYETTGSSGLGEILGDDFIVTLGNFDGEVGTAWDRAATFAHELGHNLGLRHYGGNLSTAGNYVPNLPSIMSYYYQLTGVRNNMMCTGLIPEDTDETLYKNLDYSHGRACTLNEGALDEAFGIGVVPVDWDCGGSIDGTVIHDVSNDTTGHGWCDAQGMLGTLSDYDEWASIQDVTQMAAKARPEPEVVECVTAEEQRRYEAFLEQTASKTGAVQGHCTQATLVTESCTSRAMSYLAGGRGIPAGTCRRPFRSLDEAHAFSGSGDILYVAPGGYSADGVVLDKKLLLLGPGGAVLGD